MSQRMFRCVLALLGAWPLAASAQETVATLGNLQPRSPTVLTRAELLALLPGAAMARVNDKGSTHHWTNEPGGEMVVSSDNRGWSGHASTAGPPGGCRKTAATVSRLRGSVVRWRTAAASS